MWKDIKEILLNLLKSFWYLIPLTLIFILLFIFSPLLGVGTFVSLIMAFIFFAPIILIIGFIISMLLSHDEKKKRK